MLLFDWVIHMIKQEKKAKAIKSRKFIKTKELLEYDMTYYKINRLVEEGVLEKINGNTYENLTYDGDDHDFLYVNGYVDRGVVCLMSAAAHHGLRTFSPYQIDVAIKQSCVHEKY